MEWGDANTVPNPRPNGTVKLTAVVEAGEGNYAQITTKPNVRISVLGQQVYYVLVWVYVADGKPLVTLTLGAQTYHGGKTLELFAGTQYTIQGSTDGGWTPVPLIVKTPTNADEMDILIRVYSNGTCFLDPLPETVLKSNEYDKLCAEINKLQRETFRIQQDIKSDGWKVFAPYAAAIVSVLTVAVLVSNAVLDSNKTQAQRRFDIASKEIDQHSSRMIAIMAEYDRFLTGTEAVNTLFEASIIKNGTSRDELDKARRQVDGLHIAEFERKALRKHITLASEQMLDLTTMKDVLEQMQKARARWQQQAGVVSVDFATYFPSGEDGGSKNYSADWQHLKTAALSFLDETLLAISPKDQIEYTRRYDVFQKLASAFGKRLGIQHRNFLSRAGASAATDDLHPQQL